MTEIAVRLPGRHARGFLKRLQIAQSYRERIEAQDWRALLEFADYLIAQGYVEVPPEATVGVEPVTDADGTVVETAEAVVAKAALYDMTQDEMMTILVRLANGEQRAVDPPKGG